MIRRLLLGFTLAGLACGCASDQPPPLPPATQAEADDAAEEARNFQDQLAADLAKVDGFIAKTRRGVNLTEFSLGWFTMILLGELCGQDQALYDQIHRDDMGVETFLRGPFQSDPKAEIAALGRLADQGGRAPPRAARDALEVLMHIPSGKDAPPAQAQSRAELEQALVRLRSSLSALVVSRPQ
jgi:hypothetical protein